MKNLTLVLAAALALACAWAGSADASYTTYTSKQITLNFTISPSPSPTPVAYVPSQTQSVVAAAQRSATSTVAAYVVPADPLWRAVAWEPVRLDDMVAQANPEGNVKVNFTVKPDPHFAHFHIIPHNTSFMAGYGSNTYTCAYEVFASYSTAWEVTDWVYGSNNSNGTTGLNGYPTWNYPTASNLSWKAITVTSTFAPFANEGSPGEQSFSGAANTTKQICFDLTLNVPNSTPANVYQTTIQYNMLVSL